MTVTTHHPFAHAPTSAPSAWKNPLSFRHAIMTPPPPSSSAAVAAQATPFHDPHHHHHHKSMTTTPKVLVRKMQPKFVVVKPVQRRNTKRDWENTLCIDDDDMMVLGETDAHEYYSRKAHGSKGHKNGQKSRPDEAKRLQMIMAKKNMQRRRQQKH